MKKSWDFVLNSESIAERREQRAERGGGGQDRQGDNQLTQVARGLDLDSD